MFGIDKHTLCCLHFDDSATKDECGNEWEVVGNQPSLGMGKFKKGVNFDGSASYIKKQTLTIENEFTVDCWVNFTNVIEHYGCIFSLGSTNIINNPSLFSVYCDSDGLLYVTGLDSQLQKTLNVSLKSNTYQHLAVVKRDKSIRFFIDGKLIYTTAPVQLDLSNNPYPLTIGNWALNEVRALIGYIDEFRISDVARWTSDFTPPTTPYSRNLNLYLDENNAVWGCKE